MLSIYQKDEREKLKKRAFNLYKKGLTTREVAKRVGRSHEWVAQAVKTYAQVYEDAHLTSSDKGV